ncbi:hypothetical protein B0I37DRAFT_391421 [Chaetomium sp. MPI-CAGE-AT-0009]|nr:hypothetical protein B0I37DRAFT_391421 [Chaetomium sp. MPI-CAGE-AT-0009]
MDMFWTPGSRRPSVEAFYPFIVQNDQVQYHVPENVGRIFHALDWVKKGSPIIQLPLIAHMLRTQQEPDFGRQKAALSWANILGRIHHCYKNHHDQISIWTTWSPQKQKSVLEELRTGRSGPATRTELTRRRKQWLCIVASPSRPDQRVFYQFHVLWHPEAENLFWDWGTLYTKANYMLYNMRAMCNRHAESSGEGEPKMDALRLIVWWCHHLCRKIQLVKQEQPKDSPEKVAFGILDRWGLPVVPWPGNPLSCKHQGHDVTMKFGLVWPDDEDFDPIKHFNLACCTVTIDAKATNLAMLNYETYSWDGIHEMLSAVPLSHPLWDIDPALSLRSWISNWHAAMPSPQPPRAPFKIPLLPIDRPLAGGLVGAALPRAPRR